MAWYIKGFVDRGRMLMRSHIDVYNILYKEICKSNSTILASELDHECNKKITKILKINIMFHYLHIDYANVSILTY